jgi:hypothetical protein
MSLQFLRFILASIPYLKLYLNHAVIHFPYERDMHHRNPQPEIIGSSDTGSMMHEET